MSQISALTLVVAAVVAVGLAGIISLLRVRWKLAEALNFSLEFQGNLHSLLEQRGRETYEWLTRNAVRMQHELGGTGLVSFRPPFANYIVNDYPVVLNGLAEIRKAMSDDLLGRSDLPAQYHSLVEDALMRHQGVVLERTRQNSASLRNPLTWLAAGTQALLSAPLWILGSFGILPRNLASRVRGSAVFRVFSGLLAAIGFLSAVVGLVTGWEQFVQIARKVVPGAF